MQIPDIDLLSDFEESPSVACMLRVRETPLGVSGKPRVHHLKCLLIVQQESGSYFAAERLEMPANDVELCRLRSFSYSYFPSLIYALSIGLNVSFPVFLSVCLSFGWLVSLSPTH